MKNVFFKFFGIYWTIQGKIKDGRQQIWFSRNNLETVIISDLHKETINRAQNFT